MKRTHVMPLLLAVQGVLTVGFTNCGKTFHSRAAESPPAAADQGSSSEDPPAPPPMPTPSPVAPKMVDVIMYSGHLARTGMSCDDGRTWINDRSDNPTAQCWEAQSNYLDCDHQPTSSHGLTEGDGYFFAAYGWGYNGTVRRTRDGKTWTTVNSGDWGGGLSFVAGKLFLMWGMGAISADYGATWTKPAEVFEYNDFSAPLVTRLGQKTMVYGRSNGLYSLGISRDGGNTWKKVSKPTAIWESRFFAEGNGVILISGGYGSYNQIIRSTNDGATFTHSQFAANVEGVMFNGRNFLIAGGDGRIYRSTDGLAWTSVPMMINGSPAGNTEGLYVFNPNSGTYIYIKQSFGGYYGSQKMYRSTDGVNWTEPPNSKFVGGHPLWNLIVGKMDASACAP